MRRLLVWVPEGAGETVRRTAVRHGATQAVRLPGQGADGPVDMLLLHVPNRLVDALVGDLSAVDDLHVSMFPQGVLSLQPPPEEAPDQVLDVTLRSPLEVLLSGMQSIGSWSGFLAYAVAGGLVAWVGLFTNTIYLLTASMLIAPFAGPAMNAALATARGDVVLLRRSVLRYVVGLGVAGVTAAVASALFDQATTTRAMVDTTTISAVAVVLPLAAGAAGAVNLSQSERSSLVSGAATGMLVAASLAPPVGVLGMAAVLGEWDMLRTAGFLLALQLVGINLSGAVVFRLVGITPRGARYPRGQAWLARTASVGTVAALGALLLWQFSGTPGLQRATVAQRATAVVADVLSQDTGAALLEVTARFPGADIAGQRSLLVTAYVQPTGADAEPAAVETRLARRLRAVLAERFDDVDPLVDITVVAPP